MDREIKFRAWDSRLKQMYRHNFWVDAGGNHYIDTDPRGIDMSCKKRIKRTKDLVLMQFVGLVDKNEKEIYEDDIVKFNANYTNKPCGWQKGIVKFTKYRLMFETAEHKYDMWEETDEGPYAWEVLGNIYENPEIIEQ